jgi:hypothetical protein
MYDEAKLIGCEDCGDETGRCSCGWIDGEEWLIEERGMAMAEDTSEDEDESQPCCEVCGNPCGTRMCWNCEIEIGRDLEEIEIARVLERIKQSA